MKKEYKLKKIIYLIMLGSLFCQALLFAVVSNQKNKRTYMPDRISYLLGKYRCSKHPLFRVINKKYSDAAPHYLLKEASISFEKMAFAASKDGIKLFILSGFRSHKRQRQIFESKFLGNRLVNNENLLQKFPNSPDKRIFEILKYSSIPGTSRHHWGTDLDLNSVNPKYFETKVGKDVYKWLKTHASSYGFFQPYNSGRKKGYYEEKWHWSYLPLSRKILKEYLQKIDHTNFTGFKGCNDLPKDFIETYVLGINDECI